MSGKKCPINNHRYRDKKSNSYLKYRVRRVYSTSCAAFSDLHGGTQNQSYEQDYREDICLYREIEKLQRRGGDYEHDNKSIACDQQRKATKDKSKYSVLQPGPKQILHTIFHLVCEHFLDMITYTTAIITSTTF